ncbi:LysM peptidoglycan-binding domain-containing protein [Actinomadura sp. GC306]|uniref:LysM peptidoglycan-binding domain-containing protein n=1 Tax=Actinomadura sp. GC306 TaxID=2530367 RepID=UPI0014046F55|nr:LysM peptidoglycan-binding domain-containing protein [Actinomadura sp. GC306]
MCFAAAVTLVSLWLTAGSGALAGGREDRAPVAHETVVVKPGETVWEIAVDADPDDDPQLVVQRILDLNGMGGDPTVRPGQQLRLPAD